ncbi:hypothetical protein Ciccas_010180, partial [Cichlidogyrus casuarinus]
LDEANEIPKQSLKRLPSDETFTMPDAVRMRLDETDKKKRKPSRIPLLVASNLIVRKSGLGNISMKSSSTKTCLSASSSFENLAPISKERRASSTTRAHQPSTLGSSDCPYPDRDLIRENDKSGGNYIKDSTNLIRNDGLLDESQSQFLFIEIVDVNNVLRLGDIHSFVLFCEIN